MGFWIVSLYKIFLMPVCKCLLVCLYVHHVCTDACRDQKVALDLMDPMELALLAIFFWCWKPNLNSNYNKLQ